ncbi:hypothetical protein ABZ135_22125 [Streptomyces sp. NPDC006339]|uniref:hypothetical protein n=1 Tax=Streptomyces sp. NPDC006339 TaxID=3156755 RepID=UPI00339EB921
MRIWIAIWDGSTLICRRIATWIRGGPLPRSVALLLAAGFTKGLPWTTAIVGSAAGGWFAGAIVLGLRHPSIKPGEQPPADEETAGTRTGPTVDELAHALHEIGTPHAHVAALADHLGITADATRAALTEAGIPTEPCRMKGRGSSTGVKAEHFPPLPSPASDPPVGVVAAGQNDNNNTSRRFDWGAVLFRPGDKQHAEEVA